MRGWTEEQSKASHSKRLNVTSNKPHKRKSGSETERINNSAPDDMTCINKRTLSLFPNKRVRNGKINDDVSGDYLLSMPPLSLEI